MTRAGDQAEQDADGIVGHPRRRGPGGHDGASRRGGRRRHRRGLQPVLVDRPDRRATPARSLPMLMWQDQRGTDHCFEIMARDEDAFITFVERHGIPPVGGGLSLGHILYVQHDRPDVHARTAAYVEAMDYVTARLTGRITASQHSTFMYQLCDNRTLDPPAYDDELVRARGRRRDPPAAARPDRRARSGPCCPTSRASSACPRPRRCTRAPTTPPPSRSRPARSRAGRAGISIGTTSVLVDEVDEFRVDLDTPDLLDARPVPRPLRRVRGERARRQGARARAAQRRLRRRTSSATTAPPTRSPRSTTRCGRRAPGAGGVLFLPWLGGVERTAGRTPTMRGGFVNMSLETTRRDLVRAVVEGVAHNLRWLLPPVEAFTGERDRGDRARRRRGAVRGRGARSSPTCSTGPSSRSPRPTSRSPARTALLALHRHGTWSRADLDREPSRRRAPLRTRPGPPQPLRRSTRTVRGCLRCTPPDQ